MFHFSLFVYCPRFNTYTETPASGDFIPSSTEFNHWSPGYGSGRACAHRTHCYRPCTWHGHPTVEEPAPGWPEEVKPVKGRLPGITGGNSRHFERGAPEITGVPTYSCSHLQTLHKALPSDWRGPGLSGDVPPQNFCLLVLASKSDSQGAPCLWPPLLVSLSL